MLSYYAQFKATHILFVSLSGVLFLVRGAALAFGGQWAMARPWRLLSYAIDTGLFIAGLSLLLMLSLNPFNTPWLGVKLLCLVAYIALGSLALKRAPTESIRRASFLGALALFLFMVSVALSHHPLGLFGVSTS